MHLEESRANTWLVKRLWAARGTRFMAQIIGTSVSEKDLLSATDKHFAFRDFAPSPCLTCFLRDFAVPHPGWQERQDQLRYPIGYPMGFLEIPWVGFPVGFSMAYTMGNPTGNPMGSQMGILMGIPKLLPVRKIDKLAASK